MKRKKLPPASSASPRLTIICWPGKTEPSRCHARPAAEVLSGTASEAYDDRLVGIVLTGASRDGSMGLKKIRENGGLAIVRSPETGVSEEMSGAAIAENAVDRILPQAAIGSFLYTLFGSYDG